MDKEYVEWTARVAVLPDIPGGAIHSLKIHTSALAEYEARRRVEYIGTHGFWYGVTYYPPTRIRSIHLYKAENQDDNQG